MIINNDHLDRLSRSPFPGLQMMLDLLSDLLPGTEASFDRPPGPQITFTPEPVDCGAWLREPWDEVAQIERYWINFWGADDNICFCSAHDRSMFYLGQKIHTSQDFYQSYRFQAPVRVIDEFFQWGAIAEQYLLLNIIRAGTNFTLFPKTIANPSSFGRFGNEFDVLGGPALATLNPTLRDGLEFIRDEIVTTGLSLHTNEIVQGLNPSAARFIPIAIVLGKILKGYKYYKLVSSAVKAVNDFKKYERRRMHEVYAIEMCYRNRIQRIHLEGSDLVELLSCYVDLKWFTYTYYPYFNMPHIPFFPSRFHFDNLSSDRYLNRYFFDGSTPHQADRLILSGEKSKEEYVNSARRNAEALLNRRITFEGQEVAPTWYDEFHIDRMIEEFEKYLNFEDCEMRVRSVDEIVAYIFSDHIANSAMANTASSIGRLVYSDIFREAHSRHFARRWTSTMVNYG